MSHQHIARSRILIEQSKALLVGLEKPSRKLVVSVEGKAPPKTSPKAALMQMTFFVPAGRTIPLFNAVGPCWICYDSSKPVEVRAATMTPIDANVWPVILGAMDDGSAELVSMSPGLGSPREALLRAVGDSLDHAPQPAASPQEHPNG